MKRTPTTLGKLGDKLGKRSNLPTERRATPARKVLQQDSSIPPRLPRGAGSSANYNVGMGVSADVGGRNNIRVTSSQLSPNRNKPVSKAGNKLPPYNDRKGKLKKFADTELNNN
jgi:hypothetical protein